ncbi:hypothetical protein NA57DRAFT_58112 [Rhizodiscina lignyota]|uniref:Uncharacterized protein n=1 Tax=Rhizodiscina lignyota TaxID=1504668 RepID=A0A9P4IEF1_9PEZI|nr:hypothetical protein NA57DRAFT_58112 [Rhizodiscina lignyota]
MKPTTLLAGLLPFIATASAEITFLVNCHAVQNGQNFPFAGAIYYANNPSGEVNPSTSNIAISNPGPNAWKSGNSGYAIFPSTGEVFNVGPLDQTVRGVGSVAGTAHNKEKTWTCRNDDESELFNNGFISCNKDYYCQPVNRRPNAEALTSLSSWDARLYSEEQVRTRPGAWEVSKYIT